jgi:hypothetical protein
MEWMWHRLWKTFAKLGTIQFSTQMFLIFSKKDHLIAHWLLQEGLTLNRKREKWFLLRVWMVDSFWGRRNRQLKPGKMIGGKAKA